MLYIFYQMKWIDNRFLIKYIIYYSILQDIMIFNQKTVPLKKRDSILERNIKEYRDFTIG